MKRIILIIAMVLMATTVFAANTQTSGNADDGRFEEASVDTDPGVNGYGCKPVSIQYMRGPKVDEMRFYVKSIGTGATITLQWSDDNKVTFHDYPTTRYDIEAGGRDIIRDSSAGVYYRLFIKNGEQGSSGASVFGICW